jgi:hypothetical protein
MLVLDRKQLDAEVGAIAGDSFFQSLTKVRNQLRGQVE